MTSDVLARIFPDGTTRPRMGDATTARIVRELLLADQTGVDNIIRLLHAVFEPLRTTENQRMRVARQMFGPLAAVACLDILIDAGVKVQSYKEHTYAATPSSVRKRNQLFGDLIWGAARRVSRDCLNGTHSHALLWTTHLVQVTNEFITQQHLHSNIEAYGWKQSEGDLGDLLLHDSDDFTDPVESMIVFPTILMNFADFTEAGTALARLNRRQWLPKREVLRLSVGCPAPPSGFDSWEEWQVKATARAKRSWCPGYPPIDFRDTPEEGHLVAAGLTPDDMAGASLIEFLDLTIENVLAHCHSPGKTETVRTRPLPGLV